MILDETTTDNYIKCNNVTAFINIKHVEVKAVLVLQSLGPIGEVLFVRYLYPGMKLTSNIT